MATYEDTSITPVNPILKIFPLPSNGKTNDTSKSNSIGIQKMKISDKLDRNNNGEEQNDDKTIHRQTTTQNINFKYSFNSFDKDKPKITQRRFGLGDFTQTFFERTSIDTGKSLHATINSNFPPTENVGNGNEDNNNETDVKVRVFFNAGLAISKLISVVGEDNKIDEDMKDKKAEDRYENKLKRGGAKVLKSMRINKKGEIESLNSFTGKETKKDLFKKMKLTFANSSLINPHDSTILKWLFLLSAVYLYNLIFIILRLFYPFTDEAFWQYLLITDILADIYYVIDLIVQCRTGYLQDGRLEDNSVKLLKHYFTFRAFIGDIISILPIDYVLLAFRSILPFTFLIPLTRLLRLLKYERMIYFFKRVEARNDHPGLVQIVKLFLNFVCVIFITSCFYHGLSFLIGFGDDGWVQDGQNTTLTYFIMGNKSLATTHVLFPDGELKDQTFNGLHWATQIVTTIGEVIGPFTTIEHIIVIIFLLCGIYLYARLIGEVGTIISTLNINRTRFGTKLDNLKQYMTKFKINSELQDRVIDLFDHVWVVNKGIDEQEILDGLPKELRAQIAYSGNRHLIDSIFLFKDKPFSFQIDLILSMKTQILLPNEIVYHQNHVGNDMYIIRDGKVRLTNSPNKKITSRSQARDLNDIFLENGDYFGQDCAINFNYIGRRRQHTAITEGYCSIWILEKKSLLEVLIDYPDVQEELSQYFKEYYFDERSDTAKINEIGLTNLDQLEKQLTLIKSNKKILTNNIKQMQKEQQQMRTLLNSLKI